MDKDGIKHTWACKPKYWNDILEFSSVAEPATYENYKDNSEASQLITTMLSGKNGKLMVKTYIGLGNVAMTHIKGFIGEDYYVDMGRTYTANVTPNGFEEKVTYVGAFASQVYGTQEMVEIRGTYETKDGDNESYFYTRADKVFGDALRGVYAAAEEAGINPTDMGMVSRELMADFLEAGGNEPV